MARISLMSLPDIAYNGSAGFNRKICAAVGTLFIVCLPSCAFTKPLDLSEAYNHAVTYDAQIHSAEADLTISKEEVSKAYAAFLPNIRASTSRGRNRTESFTPYRPEGDRIYYNTLSHSVSLRQPLLNMENIAAYKQAKAIEAKSESLFHGENSGLMVRTAESFFNVLYAEDNVKFTNAQVEATNEQLLQARRRNQTGFGTITEINEAQASLDMALAEKASSITGLEYSRRELERITGVYPDSLCRIVTEKIPLSGIEPRDVNAWIKLAETNNPKVGAARQDIQIARREVEKTRAMKIPSVDLVAGRSYSVSENNYTIGSTYDTWSINVQVNVPIYTGGYSSAQVRQAVAKRMKANDQYNWQERAIVSDVRKYYDGVLNGIVQIKAYEQAVKANEIVLVGTRKGFLVGMRSNVDVLNAQQKLFESRRNLAKSRYQYILNMLMLKDVAGTLAVGDIQEVNSWLDMANR